MWSVTQPSVSVIPFLPQPTLASLVHLVWHYLWHGRGVFANTSTVILIPISGIARLTFNSSECSDVSRNIESSISSPFHLEGPARKTSYGTRHLRSTRAAIIKYSPKLYPSMLSSAGSSTLEGSPILLCYLGAVTPILLVYWSITVPSLLALNLSLDPHPSKSSELPVPSMSKS